MRLSYATVLAALLMVPVLASGQGQRLTREAEDAIKRRFPDARPEVLSDREQNGVRVFHVSLGGDKGTNGDVFITEAGDFMVAPAPGYDPQRLPAPAENIIQALFPNRPSWIERDIATDYLVTLDVEGRPYRVRLDPVGRIQDINNVTQAESEQREGERSDQAQIDALMPRLRQYFQDPEVRSVSRADAPGFYRVHLTADRDRKDIVAVMDTHRDVDHWRVTVDEAKLPPAVSRTLQERFRHARITRVERVEQTYYDVRGEDQMLLRVSPAGNVLTVRPETAREAGDVRPQDRDRSDRLNGTNTERDRAIDRDLERGGR